MHLSQLTSHLVNFTMKNIFLFWKTKRGIFLWCEVLEAERVHLKLKRKSSRHIHHETGCLPWERSKTQSKNLSLQNLSEWLNSGDSQHTLRSPSHQCISKTSSLEVILSSGEWTIQRRSNPSEEFPECGLKKQQSFTRETLSNLTCAWDDNQKCRSHAHSIQLMNCTGWTLISGLFETQSMLSCAIQPFWTTSGLVLSICKWWKDSRSQIRTCTTSMQSDSGELVLSESSSSLVTFRKYQQKQIFSDMEWIFDIPMIQPLWQQSMNGMEKSFLMKWYTEQASWMCIWGKKTAWNPLLVCLKKIESARQKKSLRIPQNQNQLMKSTENDGTSNQLWKVLTRSCLESLQCNHMKSWSLQEAETSRKNSETTHGLLIRTERSSMNQLMHSTIPLMVQGTSSWWDFPKSSRRKLFPLDSLILSIIILLYEKRIRNHTQGFSCMEENHSLSEAGETQALKLTLALNMGSIFAPYRFAL